MQYQQLKKHIKSTGSTENVMLIAPKSTKDFRKSINLSERQSKKKISLSNDSVVISEKLANILNVKKGSTITLTNSHGKNYRFKGTTFSWIKKSTVKRSEITMSTPT